MLTTARENAPKEDFNLIIKILKTIISTEGTSLIFSTLHAYFGLYDIIPLIHSLGKSQELLVNALAKDLPITWYYYNFHKNGTEQHTFPSDSAQQLEIIKDYYIVKEFTNHFNKEKKEYNYLCSLLENLSLSKLLSETTHTLPISKENIIWKKILAIISENNQKSLYLFKIILKNKLISLNNNEEKQHDIDLQIKKLHSLLAEQTAIVVTFNPNLLNLNQEKTYKNFFITKTRPKVPIKNDNKYFRHRFRNEAISYSFSPPNVLLDFLIDANAHPCYGTLQFLSHIEPIKLYGDSFFVLDSSVKNDSTVFFGSPAVSISKKKTQLKPIRLNEPLTALIAQFPEKLLASCLATDYQDSISSQYNMQYIDAEAEFMEVHFPSNLQLDDVKHIKHIHFNLSNNFLENATLEKLISSGIAVTIGINPFKDKNYLQAFQSNTIANYLINKISYYIYQTALFIGETTPVNLKCHIDKEAIRFNFDITYNNTNFHQAQAASLLYLLGARRLFTEKIPAIRLKEKKLDYKILLNNTVRNEGDVYDHDAYTYEYNSLRKLLNIFLKRIFSNIIVTYQNQEHLFYQGSTHPFTGKGSTEESNLTKEIFSNTNKKLNDLDFIVNWLYDSIVIEVLSSTKSNFGFIFKSLSSIIKENIYLSGKFIHVDLTIPNLLKLLETKRFPYQSCVIFEDINLDQYGDLLLAFRYGYTTPGGHNNDPYSWIGGFTDIEFGKINFKKFYESKYKNFQNPVGSTKDPSTIYYSIPSSCLTEIKEDKNEFIPGSLERFPIYSLGNLNSTQIKTAADILKITEEEYKNTFNQSLPLRPLPSIIVYLNYYETFLEEKLSKTIKNTTSTQDKYFIVKINKDYTTKKHDQLSYWLPTGKFGEIIIQGDKANLSILQTYFNYFKVLLQNRIENDHLILEKTNPQLLAYLLPSQAILDDNFKILEYGLELLKQKKNSILIQFSFINMANILLLSRKIKKQRPSIVKSLRENGAFIYANLIKEFIKLSNFKLNNESKSEDEHIPDKEIHELKIIINCLLMTKWLPNKSTILHYAIKNNDVGIVKFICKTRQCSLLNSVVDSFNKVPINYINVTGKETVEILSFLANEMRSAANLPIEPRDDNISKYFIKGLIEGYAVNFGTFDASKIEMVADTISTFIKRNNDKDSRYIIKYFSKFVVDKKSADGLGVLLKYVFDNLEKKRDLIKSTITSLISQNKNNKNYDIFQNTIFAKDPAEASENIQIIKSDISAPLIETKTTLSNYAQPGLRLFPSNTPNSTPIPSNNIINNSVTKTAN